MDRRRSEGPGGEEYFVFLAQIPSVNRKRAILSQSGRSTEFPALGEPSGRGRPRQEERKE